MKPDNSDKNQKMESEPKNKRKFQNFYINPTIQFRYGLVAISYSFLGITFVHSMSIIKLKTFPLDSNKEAMEWFISYSNYMLMIFAVSLILIGLSAFILSFFFSHQVAGAIVPIVRHIKELQKGNYKIRTQLRNNDHLSEIANALNDYSKSLDQGK